MTTSLLPPNSTQLEHAWSRLGLGELEGLGDLPAGVQITLPPGYAPFVAAQFFLAQFAEYFDTPEALIAAGLPWLRQRGTGAAVERALGWIDIDATVEEDGPLLHLDPGSPRAPARLADIRKLIAASIPAHVRFYRLFHGYDVRHARLDRSRWDGALLDDDSGLVVDGLKLSFGERHASLLPTAPRDALPARTHSRALLLRRDSMYWDAWVWDSLWEMDLFGGVGSMHSALVPDRALAAPVLLFGRVGQALVPRDLPAPLPASTQHRATTTPERFPRRRWSGPWSGPWRLVIHSNHSTEV
ncbi:phage tail protein [Pseudomonas paralcaligenes]|uniref:phage tail protein n=1 Tax=Pseudomonas paralcaligenes TaxID=2772558 RepID=UPI001C7FAEFD|nr:phage tail protein [Pseudomonas paralcaligenes]